MEDREIMALFRAGEQKAVAAAAEKYGKGCFKIAYSVLGNREDAEETVNEMWLKVWKPLQTSEPDNLFAFLSASTRNLALDRLAAQQTAKRGGGLTAVPLEDADRTVSSEHNVEDETDGRLLTEAVERFLDSLSADRRTIFVERYTNGLSPAEIAEEFGITAGRVRLTLMRVRRQLETYLKKEGYL